MTAATATRPATQPALPLATTNRHCEGVRQAVASSKAAFPTLPKATLLEARAELVLCQQELRNAWVLVRDHHALSVQAEVAGKSVKHLLAMVDARLEGQAP